MGSCGELLGEIFGGDKQVDSFVLESISRDFEAATLGFSLGSSFVDMPKPEKRPPALLNLLLTLLIPSLREPRGSSIFSPTLSIDQSSKEACFPRFAAKFSFSLINNGAWESL